MWRLQQIYAKDFSAFKELDYAIQQSHATLIFGNNMDNDSQLSNGSGKSALIEAIAVGLTGATLRNIKIDEIINDNADEATVSLLLSNDFTGQYATISRVISRKNPQAITVLLSNGQKEDGEFDWEPVSQASVLDYNKYVLDLIGITKDDIYANYILCKHKYSSFLSSSDKDKKEIINRFSNGILVDESIAALQEDMKPIQDSVYEAEKNVSTCQGRIEAIEEQIEKAVSSNEERAKSREERIANLRQLIADKRALIRERKEAIANYETRLADLDVVYTKLTEIENASGSIEDDNKAIKELFAKYGFQFSDYMTRLASLKNKLKELERDLAEQAAQDKQRADAVKTAKTKHDSLVEEFNAFKEEYDAEMPEVEETIRTLTAKVRKMEAEIAQNRSDNIRFDRQIAALNKQLAGVITCPKCGHEFSLSEDIDIEQVRDSLADLEGVKAENEERIEATQKDIDNTIEDGKKAREKQTVLNTKQSDWSKRVSDSQLELDRLIRIESSHKNDRQDIENQIDDVQRDIEDLRSDMFDDAFQFIDSETDTAENAQKDAERAISNAEGSIQSFEESIADAEKALENDVIDNLKQSKAKYQKDYEKAVTAKEKVEKELAKYRSQETTFVEFKTHLANSKIEALAHITNEFLEKIGSDIRISFSGFTILKSGKVRDKISISLLRDGVNCGSFDKFSEGEKARVNLANILAMHKLTNVSCAEGKGLDLLILDEILDATDETGLANIFESLNSLQITSLIVSHGNIAENYPYKLVVNKRNGISFI